jgi:uncharacterized protein YgbK (DUF1537 family)
MRIVVIADDLSGAAEVAGIAFAQGLSAEVQRGFDPQSAAEVLVVDTDSRGLAEVAALERVEAITRQVIAAGPCRLFKKVDSLLRGWPRAEIEAMLRASGQRRSLLIPANPSRSRVIENGQYLVGGLPLDQTEFARDPEHPRRSADVRMLLGNGVAALSLVGVNEALPPAGIVVPDATRLEHLACRADQVDSDTLSAGAADLFAAWLQDHAKVQPRADAEQPRLEVTLPALFVCGSRLAIRERASEAAKRGVRVMYLRPGEMDSCANAVVAILAHNNSLLFAISDAPSFLSPRELTAHLASTVAEVVARVRVATLLVEGGASAAAAVERLGWRRMAVAAVAPPGIGVLSPLDVAGRTRLIIKPGSYPWPVDVWPPSHEANLATYHPPESHCGFR